MHNLGLDTKVIMPTYNPSTVQLLNRQKCGLEVVCQVMKVREGSLSISALISTFHMKIFSVEKTAQAASISVQEHEAGLKRAHQR